MAYVGVLAWLLDIDLDKIYQALNFHFKGKTKPIDLNFGVVQAAYDYANHSLTKTDPYRVEPMAATDGYIMADGNTAAALGRSTAGAVRRLVPDHPGFQPGRVAVEYLPILRRDSSPDGKNTYAVVQAEDELAAIGMAVGAGWAGLRSMTSTSGLAEPDGGVRRLAYFAEVPLVVWDVQRVGPSTGLPTRTAQGDLTFTHFMAMATHSR